MRRAKGRMISLVVLSPGKTLNGEDIHCSIECGIECGIESDETLGGHAHLNAAKLTILSA